MYRETKLEMLQALYAVHEEWTQSISFACVKGCAHCCTQSVTMTRLEGVMVLTRCGPEAIDRISFKKDDKSITYKERARVTTNHFASRCLAGEETEFAEDPWHLAPCPFLDGNLCRIYPARPFGCRSFGSVVRCNETASAEVPPLVLTVNTVLMQIIEHLDQGRPWGNMLDILRLLAAEGEGSEDEGNAAAGELAKRLAVSEPIPGFLVPPEEEEAVNNVLRTLYAREIGGKTFGELLLSM